jgi:hypothetical protein
MRDGVLLPLSSLDLPPSTDRTQLAREVVAAVVSFAYAAATPVEADKMRTDPQRGVLAPQQLLNHLLAMAMQGDDGAKAGLLLLAHLKGPLLRAVDMAMQNLARGVRGDGDTVEKLQADRRLKWEVYRRVQDERLNGKQITSARQDVAKELGLTYDVVREASEGLG